MKVKRSEIKTCKCAYLYSDGHLVLVHSKRDKDAGDVEWATIYKDVGIETRFKSDLYGNKGRLVIHENGSLPFILQAKRIEADTPSVEKGSYNTRARNIRVSHVSLYNGVSSYRGLHITLFPDLISSGFTFQPDIDEDFDVYTGEDKQYYYGCTRIKKVYE